ncbi:helix-turn-helix domain-containing protein [Neisseriaceae bacterium B2N2-7]|uniref:Helix-turn-helix domain-containing protein n=2 Tax=Craterilacuibacter sinensis TaxID=2686017 RepID=A0A845BJG1_9NEIS|nr:helix-turn-helix domain-containing protein [Craterilacuibacter sinensis]
MLNSSCHFGSLDCAVMFAGEVIGMLMECSIEGASGIPMDISLLFPLFSQWPAEERQALLSQGRAVAFAAGSEIISIQQTVHEVLFVTHGLMTAYTPGKRAGRPFCYGYIVPGDIIGLHALFEPRPFGVAVQVLRDTRGFSLPLDVLVQALDAKPQAWRSIAELMTHAVHHLLNFVSMLSEPDGYSRLKRVLEALEQHAQAHPAAPGLHLTQRELGERIGLSREMVNRMLKALRTGGYIQLNEEGGIVIAKPLPERF